jgi:uncharacterized membrane protein YsdA (DUF1294 family)
MNFFTALHAALSRFSPVEILLYLVVLNAATFALYGADKRAAIRQGPRVPEKALHTLAALGGSPAAWFAQRHFRHKTRKGSFQAVFWLIAVLQGALLAGLIIT